MPYILEDNTRVRKWQSGHARCRLAGERSTIPLTPEEFELVKKCDGRTELDPCDSLYLLEAMGVIRRCEKGEADPSPGQIREYPNKLSCIIDWTITERCNYNCLHCFHAADNNMSCEEFTLEEALRFLEEAEACGVPAIRLTGGEPTLYPHFHEIVEEIRRRGMYLKTLITNGSLFDDEMAGFIKRVHPRVQIMLSFDGIGTHDWLRQHEGSEERVKRAIKAGKDAGLNVRINMNVNRRSRPVITDSVKMLADLGVDSIRIIKTTEVPRWALNAADNSMTPEEYYDFSIVFAEWYRESGLSLPVVIWQSLYLNGRDRSYHVLPVKSPECRYRDDAVICKAMTKKISVQANGEIIPCSSVAGVFTQRGIHTGNVKSERLQDLLSEGPLYDMVTHTVKDRMLATPKCASCSHFKRCQGGCPAIALLYNGSLLSQDDYKCTFFNKGYDKKYVDAMDGWKNLID